MDTTLAEETGHEMPGRANDLIVIPDSFWQRPEVTEALRSRDVGRFFALVRQFTGASQTQIGMACGMSQGKISDIMRGVSEVKHLEVFEQIADGLDLPDAPRIALGLAPRVPSPHRAGPQPREAIPEGDTRPPLPSPRPSSLLNLISEDEHENDDPVRRRTFVGLTAASLGAIFADAKPDTPILKAEPFAPVLAAQPGTVGEAIGRPPEIRALAIAVDNARQQYQDCRYSGLIESLPSLLAQLHAACLALDGDERSRAFALSADAHHVAAGLLLKLDDQGLAFLAADRSMRAAETSADPVTIGASARIVTHTLMAGGHLGAAITTASSHAERLDHEMPAQTPDSLSVYGSLLLRGAIAAAQHDKRGTAHELLGEADEAARRLGVDGNLRWTAFGPTNTKVHRVSIAVMLGDAGTAVDVARKIDLGAIEVTERKASLLLDTARAFLQWGKPAKAYIALRAAEETAHEEVAGRPSVHRVVRELMTSAPPSMRRDVEQFAAQIGVSR
jgi:transcriptional regulator with XRE-family HTH domain